MKVILIRPPISAEKTFPLDLAHQSAALKAAGHHVCAFDLALSAADLRQRLLPQLSTSAAVYITTSGVGVCSYPGDWPALAGVAAEIRRASSVPIIVGGHYATLCPQACLQERAVDYVIEGDAEAVVVELLSCLDDLGQQLPPAVHRRGRPARPRCTPPSLDSYADADYAVLDLDRYHAPLFWRGGRSAPVITSRGCTHRCAYCAVPRLCRGTARFRDIDKVIGELAQLREEHQVRHAVIEDDMFSLDPARVRRFCEALQERDLDISWSCLNGLRIDTLKPALIEQMYAAGCTHIAFGIESFDPDEAAAMGRPSDRQALRDLLATCAERGMQTTGYFLLDFRRFSLASIFAAVRLAKREPSLLMAHFSLVQPPPTDTLPSSMQPAAKKLVAKKLVARAANAFFYLDHRRLAKLWSAGCFKADKHNKLWHKLIRG